MTRALWASCFSLVLALSVPAQLAQAKTLNGFDLSDALVRQKLIRAGGPPRDGIPAIFAPRFVAAADASELDREDRVLGIDYAGIARAYPIKILNYHEIVNDSFGGVPVAVTFCPLCGTGMAFLAEAAGETRTFGVSGLLYNSDVLMYDRETESLWSQIMAKAVSGPARGAELEMIPVRHTTWGDWSARHTQTQVLAAPRAYGRDYNVDPYLGYADSSRVWFPVAHKDRRYPAKDVVLGIAVDGASKAYPFSELPNGTGRIADIIAGQSVTVEYDQLNQAGRIIDASGTELPSFTAFWFAWVAFHPDTAVYTSR